MGMTAEPFPGRGWLGARAPYWLGPVVIVVSLVLTIWGFVGLNLVHEYSSAKNKAHMDAALVADVMQESLLRSVEAIDAQLRRLGDLYARDPENFATTATRADNLLHDLPVQIGIVDADGLLRYSSLQPTSQRIDLSDREHIRVQLDSAEDDLFISKPVVGRVSGLTTVQFTRKILDAQAALLGVIVISLDSRQLARLRKTWRLDIRLLIVGQDGVVRAAAPAVDITGKDISTSRLLRTAKEIPAGDYRGELRQGEPDSFVSFRQVGNYGLLVAAGAPTATAFSEYWDSAKQTIGIGAVLSLLSIGFGAGLVRYRRYGQSSRQRLEDSEARLRGLLTASPDALVVMDDSGHIVMASDQVAAIFGYDAAALTGQSIELLVPSRYHRTHAAHVRAYLADPRTRPMGNGLEVFARRKDGSEFPAAISLSAYSCAIGQFVIAAVRDVTLQQQMQQELRRWSDAFEKAAFGLSITDAKTLHLISVNPAYAAMHGMTPDEMRAYPVINLVASEDQENLLHALALVDQTGQMTYESIRQRKDGSRFPAQLATTAVYDEHGEPLYRIATLLDISERKRAEAEAYRWAETFNKAAFGIAITDADSRNFITVNPAFAAMHGMTLEELRGYPTDRIFVPEDRASLDDLRETINKTGHISFEASRLRKDGSRFFAQINITDVRDDDGRPAYRIASVLDISESRQMRDHLQQVQKMEAIGQLTAGIAHDFNNLLGAIINNQDRIIDEVAHDPGAARRHAEDALDAALSGADLVKHLLAFSRQQAMHPQPVDFSEFSDRVLPIIRRTIGENIEVKISAAPGLWPMLTAPGQVESALLNLAINARDAVPNGGTLSITAANATVDQEPFAEMAAPKPGDYVLISVTDNGVGMSADVVSHAFEPFFTTKGVGEGSGLGLSMVLGSMEQLGGTAKIYSEPGQGTTVTLYLPRALPPPPCRRWQSWSMQHLGARSGSLWSRTMN